MNEKTAMTREQALEELRLMGIEGPEVYLIDVIPLIEMIWADGRAQDSEIYILNNYLVEHVRRINEIAGYEMLTVAAAKAFVTRFLKKRPSPDLLRFLRELLAPVRMASPDAPELKESLLSACMDIASSSVVKYPYGWNERFNPAEKKCFFEILDSLGKSD